MTRLTTCRLTVFFSASLLAIAPSAFAVDGAILSNQNTSVNGLPGCPHAGFPIIICQSGSYRLSGDLTMITSAAGNYSGVDIAIGIASSKVTLDLNGFPITVNDFLGDSLTHDFFAIAELGTFSQVTVRNGTVTLNSTRASNEGVDHMFGIYLQTSSKQTIEAINIAGNQPRLVRPFLVIPGKSSLIRSVVTNGVISPFCPSLIIDAVGRMNASVNCVIINNSDSAYP